MTDPVAVFTLSGVAVPEGNHFVFTGKAFEVGSYPDKKFALSETEADAAIAAFTGVLMNYEHVKGPLDGNLGTLDALTRSGKDLIGRFSVPAWLKAASDTHNIPLKVSLEWNRKTKQVVAGAWVLKPRIHDAQLTAAFSQFNHSQGNAKPHLPHLPNPPKLLHPNREKVSMLTKIREALEAKGVEMDDDLSALFASEREEEIVAEANTFAKQMLTDGKIVPAEKDLCAAAFAQAKRDDDAQGEKVSFSVAPVNPKKTDEKRPEGTRAELVRALYSRRPAHTLTDETLVTQDAAVFALGNGGDDEEAAKAKESQARKDKALASTETGRAILKERGKKS